MASCAGISKRQAKKLATKDRRQQGKHHALEAQREIRLRLPFPVPAEPRLYLAKSAFGPKLAPRLGKADRAEVEGRTMTTIANNGSITHAGVPNPNYVAGADIPRYAALRFGRCIGPDIARQLLEHVKVLQEARMPFQTTASHGNTFKQAWIGLWRRSSATPFVSAGRRQKKPVLDQGIKNVMQMLDQSLGRAASYLRKVDEPTYTRMRQSHRDITKAVLSSLCGHAGAEGHRAWFDEDAGRARTSSFRLGGIGSMMAVSISTGAGTSYHYDKGDDAHFYSMILVLGTGGLLKLPEVGYEMYVNPGDVVFFLANQQLHKLEVDPTSPQSVQTVFTIWTDRLAMQSATPSPYNDFYRHET